MKILLVQPKSPASFWTCSEAESITGCAAYMQNLALPTLAAAVPADVEVRILDEAVEPIDFDEQCDLVGITGYITHRSRMVAIADAFRRRGRLVAIGGPYASLSPATLRPHADILFIGEAEQTWPEFLTDFRSGQWRAEYRAVETVDIHSSPLPAADKLRPDRYVVGVVQASRGCPFECEFCDVIVYLGRKQRYKTPERVVAEVDQLYSAGYRYMFIADDNFTANRRKAAQVMRAIEEWNRKNSEPVSFITQLSIDVARDNDIPLVDLCVAAGLREAFIGIETPDPDALHEVKKHQNVTASMVADVHRLQRRGMIVWAGMICGFDADTTASFRRQYEFAQEAGTPIVSLSLLSAPEGTPLEKRLAVEGRLAAEMSDVFMETNILPKQMTKEQLILGARWLWNKLYAPAAFLERVAVLARHLPERTQSRTISPQSAIYWQKVFAAYERMGPEFRSIPREAVKLFRKKDSSLLGGSLVFYSHAVGLLRKWGVWDPSLAALEEPGLGWAGKSAPA